MTYFMVNMHHNTKLKRLCFLVAMLLSLKTSTFKDDLINS